MKHIRSVRDAPLCGELLADGSFVDAALASDCDACRGAVGIVGVNEKQWNGQVIGVHPEPVWQRAPMADADEICANVREAHFAFHRPVS